MRQQMTSEEPVEFHWVLTVEIPGQLDNKMRTFEGTIGIWPGQSRQDVYYGRVNVCAEKMGYGANTLAVTFWSLERDELVPFAKADSGDA